MANNHELFAKARERLDEYYGLRAANDSRHVELGKAIMADIVEAEKFDEPLRRGQYKLGVFVHGYVRGLRSRIESASEPASGRVTGMQEVLEDIEHALRLFGL